MAYTFLVWKSKLFSPLQIFCVLYTSIVRSNVYVFIARDTIDGFVRTRNVLCYVSIFLLCVYVAIITVGYWLH